jgi:hypothetical protein
MIFRSRPETPTGRGLQDFVAPFIEIKLRDDLEQDLSDLAAAAVVRMSSEVRLKRARSAKTNERRGPAPRSSRCCASIRNHH